MRKFLAALLFIVFLAAFAVCEAPYMGLRPGSFLESVLLPLNFLLSGYAGFFPSGPYAGYTLLPLVLMLWFTAADVFNRARLKIWLGEFLLFIGIYIISFSLYGPQGFYFGSVLSGLGTFSFPGGCVVCAAGVLLLLAALIGSVKRARAARRKARNEEVPENPEDGTEENSMSEIERMASSMTWQNARDSLTALEIPQYRNYRNVYEPDITDSLGVSINSGAYGAAFEDGNLHRSANDQKEEERREKQDRINEVFRPRNIRRKLEEEARAGLSFPSFDNDRNFDIQNPTPISQPAANNPQVIYVQQPPQQPVAPQVIYVQQPAPVQPQVIVVRQDQTQALQPEKRPEPQPAAQPATQPETQADHKPAAVMRMERVESEPIIDEGTDGEDEIESAHERYRRMKEEEAEQKMSQQEADFVSGVGGLKRSSSGYLYSPSRFTWKYPSETLLRHYNVSTPVAVDIEHDRDGRTIVETFREFRIETILRNIQHGPTFTLYELALAKGIRINQVVNLADNLALELAVPSVRVLAPIPGKSAIGVEVPNKRRDTIGFDTMMPALKSRQLKIPMVLGKTITGESVIVDLAGAPHLLIAGTTGSGKSVCVNSLICSVLYTKTPKDVRMLLVDPKMVELSMYNNIGHLLAPVITDPKKAIKAMAWCVEEMERRMSMFSQMGARKIEDYNKRIREKRMAREELPYIMVIIDEFADLMMVVGKELESYIKRITAVARFTGIHLVLATQRPSADVITGIIKSNMPSQIAFAVSNQVNSRIILDNTGAEKLLGKGDMLYASASNPAPQRIQGAFIDTDEIEKIVEFVKSQGEPDYIDESYFEDDDQDDVSSDSANGQGGSEDLFTRAWKIVYERGEASASYLQRRLSIGYNRAANLIEQMEDQGIIGPARGSKPREVIKAPDFRSEGYDQ